MRRSRRIILTVLAVVATGSITAAAGGPGNPAPVKEEGGIWTAEGGSPTYDIRKDGTVDWGTFVGYLRYSESCLRCHGSDGAGSLYVPDFLQKIKGIDYSQFMTAITAGIKAVNTAQQLVMPTFANDRNVMCFSKEIYSYLLARADAALGRGRPEKHAPTPPGFDAARERCLGIAM